jgi:four helix bundle protein
MSLPSTRSDSAHTLSVDRLDAYAVALEFAAFAAGLRVRPASLADQLERASVSIPLNVAEGVGRASTADQARVFAIARGSALECVAVLDVLQARGALAAEDHADGRRLLARLVAMLTGLMRRRAHGR